MYKPPRHQILNGLARQLCELSEDERKHVIGMAEQRIAAENDPVKQLAFEVSKLDGYALGAFMQYLMAFGNENQKFVS